MKKKLHIFLLILLFLIVAYFVLTPHVVSNRIIK